MNIDNFYLNQMIEDEEGKVTVIFSGKISINKKEVKSLLEKVTKYKKLKEKLLNRMVKEFFKWEDRR